MSSRARGYLTWTIERGAGQAAPAFTLHAENGIEPASAAIEALAKGARVIAPTHPGFGRSELPKGMRSVDDLSYFYLDLLDQLDLRDVILVGVSFGAWLAAEIAVKSTARLSRLVMANAVGIKVGDRETRDIADIFALTDKEYLDIAYCDPAVGARDYKALPDGEVLAAARAREATARFAWSPYFHNPRLKSRAAPHPHPDAVPMGCSTIVCSARPMCRSLLHSMIAGAHFESIESAPGTFLRIRSSHSVLPSACWLSRTVNDKIEVRGERCAP